MHRYRRGTVLGTALVGLHPEGFNFLILRVVTRTAELHLDPEQRITEDMTVQYVRFAPGINTEMVLTIGSPNTLWRAQPSTEEARERSPRRVLPPRPEGTQEIN